MANIAALNTVYNHFVTTYAPEGTNTRYDTHKKSELRGVYNSIVKQNKDDPLFLLDNSSKTQEYAVGLKEGARSLKNVISSLSLDNSDGLLNQKTVSSSNEDIVTASYIGSNEGSSAAPELLIEVKQLAKPQQNNGKFMEPDKMDLEPGTYSFDIHSHDMDYEFQFNIGASDTNKLVQEKLSRLITRSNIGVKAEVVTREDGFTALELESNETGTKEGKATRFDVTDDKTSKQRGVVDYLGIGTVTQSPVNSLFTINSDEHSTFSNSFTIDKTYELTLKNTTEEGESVQVGLKTDVESVTENINYLVEGYNSFISKVSAYLDSQPYSNRLVREMNGISSLYSNQLKAIGMNVDDNGLISIDRNRLSQTASEDNAMEQFDAIRSFTGSVLGKMNQVSLNPMNYTQRTVVAYKNPGHTFTSPYVTSNYSGMMFSSYC